METLENLEALIAQKNALEEKIKALRAQRTDAALAQIKALIAEHGLQQSDIFAKKEKAVKTEKGPKGVRAKVEPKFKDPVTGATWSGRGKTPKWMAGKDPKDFSIH